MKRLTFILVLVLVAGIPWVASGGQFLGGKGFLHTNSAAVIPQGGLDVSLYMRAYAHHFEGGGNMYNGTAAFNTAFGFTRHVEFGFAQVLYQDLNSTKRADAKITMMMPGDASFRFKFGGYPLTDKFLWGVMPSLRYRVARFHDVHLEPYQSYAVEAEIMLLGSYFEKPLYPDDGYAMHFNLSYTNHNDEPTLTESSQDIFFLATYRKPKIKYDYGAELYGSFFAKRPRKMVQDREDWMYITPFMRYKLYKGLQFTLGLDALLLGYTNTSSTKLGKVPNYSKWRLTGRVNFNPSTAFYAAPTFAPPEAPETGRARRTYDRNPSSGGGYGREALFKWVIEEKSGEVEAIDLDLEKVRLERIKAEEELQRLKKELEQKQKEKQQTK
ncbi:MAG: hypothetical protein V2A61_03960 [Calditrichota bacterium]